MAVVDLEAGLEHLSRGTARHVQTLLVIGEPYFKSLETAGRSFTLARELGIQDVRMVANKVRSRQDEETMRSYADRHGLPVAAIVPYDEAVIKADETGMALIDLQPDAPSVKAIRALADHLLEAAPITR